MSESRCKDCGRFLSHYDAIQVLNNTPGDKYKVICEPCFNKHPNQRHWKLKDYGVTKNPPKRVNR